MTEPPQPDHEMKPYQVQKLAFTSVPFLAFIKVKDLILKDLIINLTQDGIRLVFDSVVQRLKLRKRLTHTNVSQFIIL